VNHYAYISGGARGEERDEDSPWVVLSRRAAFGNIYYAMQQQWAEKYCMCMAFGGSLHEILQYTKPVYRRLVSNSNMLFLDRTKSIEQL